MRVFKMLSSTKKNNFDLDSEGLAVCKERRDPVKKHTVTPSLQTSYFVKGFNCMYSDPKIEVGGSFEVLEYAYPVT